MTKKSAKSSSPHERKTKAQLIEELTAMEQNAAMTDTEPPDNSSPEDLFRASFDSSTNLMAVTRVDDGRHYSVNRAWMEALGFTREEAVGKTSTELGVWHKPEHREEMIRALRKYGVVRNFRATIQAKSGELLECLISMSALTVNGEEYLLFSGYDITTLETLQEELRRSERMHKVVAKQAGIAFWRWSFDEEILTDWSEEYARINAYDGDIPKTYDDMLQPIVPEDRDAALKAYEESDKALAGFDIEYRITSETGEILWLREYAEIEYDTDDRAVAQVGFIQDITEFKRAQESLRTSHEDLERIIEEQTRELREREAQYAHAERIAHLHNWTSDATMSEWLTCSENTEQVIKIPKNQLIGPHSVFFSFVHEDDRAMVKEGYAHAVQNSCGYEHEYRLCPPDSDEIIIHDTGEPVFDDAGTLVFYRGTAQDVTEQKRQEEERRRQGIMSQQAGILAGLGHWVWDEIEDRCLYASEGIPDIYGITMEEYLQHKTKKDSDLQHIHPDDRDRISAAYNQDLKKENDIQLEYRVFHTDGSEFWLREVFGIYEQENGRVKSTIGTIQDITRDKLAQQALEESEKRNRAVVETAANGIITISENGIIESFNQAAERMFGHQQNEVIGKNVSTLIPGIDSDQHDEYIQNYLRTGIAKIINIGREVEGLRKNGTTFPLHLAVSHINTGGANLFTGIVHDISDLKEAERLALIARDEAERANDAKTDFLAHMSHEFRTPLNAIIGFSQAMLKEIHGELGNPKYTDYINDIQNSGHLLLHIVNDILDISKIEAGEMEMSEDVFYPVEAIQECITTMGGLSADSKNAPIIFSDETKALSLLADERIFKQIVLNLLSNAIKFTPPEGQITLSTLLADDDGLIIRVEDTGCGIPEEDLGLVLEPFGQSRADSQTAHKGTGLGLSLSKILMEMHDASLSIESEVGKGTAVTLRFPPGRSSGVERS